MIKFIRYMIERHGIKDTARIQALLYCCQGWSLGIHGVPMFSESLDDFEELVNGKTEIDVSDLGGDKCRLNKCEEALVDGVVEEYEDLSNQGLWDIVRSANESGDVKGYFKALAD